MADKLKEIPGKILEWWNKFTSKQKTILIATIAVAVFTVVIVTYTFTRPEYTKIGTYSNTSDAAKVVEILNDAGITHKESTDGLVIEVENSQLTQAHYALATAGFTPDDLKYGDWVQSSMSTTSADRENQYTMFLQKELENMFLLQAQVESAQVMMNRPRDTGRLTDQQAEVSVTVTLGLRESISSATAAALAQMAACSMGNASTANINIMDRNGNMLFAGGDDYDYGSFATSMQELQEQAHTLLTNRVKKVLLGTGQYSMIEVSSHLDMDFSEYRKNVDEYYANSGQENGMLIDRETFESSSSNGLVGIPGTDTNDGNEQTGYLNPDASSGESSQSERKEHFQPNHSYEEWVTSPGSINYDSSSIAVSMFCRRDYYEETVKAQGLLDGMTWEEFKAANSRDVKLEVDEEYYSMVANATGISQDRITILAYESPVFYDKEGLPVSGTDILSIVMIVLILGLLGFVVLRSMRVKKEAAEEPVEEELSVEEMLQSMPESELEDIDLEAKSEKRLMVEKFVDENPDAAASLLRNWLSDDWG